MRKKDDANEGGGGEIPDKQIGINNILPQKYNFETQRRGRIIDKIARKRKDNKRVVGNGLER
jgi:hypothetical protein